MAQVDKIYRDILKGIRENGYLYPDESRGVMCKQISSLSISLPVVNEIPLLTTKKLFHRGIITELVWFLQGQDNIKYLLDRGVNIWNDDAYNWYLKVRELFEYNPDNKEMSKEEFIQAIKDGSDYVIVPGNYRLGDVGRNYGVQWRTWMGVSENVDLAEEGYEPTLEWTTTDQISNLIRGIRAKVMNRRSIITAWNPDEINHTALPPCHWAFELLPRPLYLFEKEEYFPGKEFGLDLKWHQRSVDTFLGLPFNIGSYAVLNHFLADMLNFQALNIIGDLSNVHLYENSWKEAEEQEKRSVDLYKGAQLSYSPKLQALIEAHVKFEITAEEVIAALEPEDFIISDYNSFDSLKVDMLAPKKI